MKKRDKIHNFFIGGQNFKEEFRKQTRTLIVVTLGFTIAFTWRQTIFDATQALVQKLSHTDGLPSSIVTSVAITVISLLIIYATSQLLKERRD